MEIRKVNLEESLSTFTDHWNPRIIGELNGQQVKVAKLKGEFVMHHHEHEDEMFLVIKGHLKMVLEKATIAIGPGEFIIIPKGTPHKPIADEEVELLLFEPASTLNTGNVENDYTRNTLDKI